MSVCAQVVCEWCEAEQASQRCFDRFHVALQTWEMQKALSTAAVLLCDLDKVEFVS